MKVVLALLFPALILSACAQPDGRPSDGSPGLERSTEDSDKSEQRRPHFPRILRAPPRDT